MALPKHDRVQDQDRIKDYRTELPNVIDDFGLSVYAHRLYTHYKRACGAEGSCEQGVRYIADVCKMSTGMVTQAKKELIEAGLIWIEPIGSKGGVVDKVTLPDLWQYNFPIYHLPAGEKRDQAIEDMKRSLCEHPNRCSSCEHQRSRSEHQRSSREHKKEHSKKEQLEKEQIQTLASPASIPDPINISEVPNSSSAVPDLLKDSPKSKKKSSGKRKKADVPPPADGVLDAICVLCYGTVEAYGLNAATIRQAYNKIAACCAPLTIDELRGFYLWWKREDWRGKKGQPPKPYQVSEQWATFKATLTKSGALSYEPRTSDDKRSSSGDSPTGEGGASQSVSTAELFPGIDDPERVARIERLMRTVQGNGVLRPGKTG